METEKMNRKRAYSIKVIREALLELLKTKPLSKITVTDICKQADVNRTTFYANYEDIYDLLRSIVQELYEKIQKVLVQYYTLDGLSYYKLLFKTLEENADACYIALRISKQEYKAMNVDFQYSSMKWVRQWRAAQGSSLKSRIVIDYLLAGNQSIINNWLDNNLDIPAEDLAEQVHLINIQLLENNNLIQYPHPRKFAED